MKYFLLLFLFVSNATVAQLPGYGKKELQDMKRIVSFLSDDKLEGRRTGTPGEQLAAAFISKEFKAAGLQPKGDSGSYLQHFKVNQQDRTGKNVIGYIDNKAAYTIVLGAHYDHLGYGEDANSMYRDSIPMIHNGADDNASGTAMLIELGKWLRKSGPKKYNYVLVAFSGEELGLFGSKYFTENPPVPINSINYMINLDMVGRLNDSSSISVGGYGTSPAWSKLVSTSNPLLKIKIDSSGTGPSDHTSFYRKDIPVLFFFTGTHSDYHRPTDDKEKLNYNGMLLIFDYIKNIISTSSKMDRLAFAKTREVSMGRTSFKVTMGVMLDYTFAGPGIFVEGVSSGKPAEKAGVQKGDIIVQLGEHAIANVEAYMKALSTFDKGQSTIAKIKRGDKEIVLPIVF